MFSVYQSVSLLKRILGEELSNAVVMLVKKNLEPCCIRQYTVHLFSLYFNLNVRMSKMTFCTFSSSPHNIRFVSKMLCQKV